MLRPKPKVFTKTKTPNHTCLRRLHKKLLTVISLMTLAAVLSASVPARNNLTSSATATSANNFAISQPVLAAGFWDFFSFLGFNSSDDGKAKLHRPPTINMDIDAESPNADLYKISDPKTTDLASACGTGGNTFTVPLGSSIQNAINAANPTGGDVIQLAPGTYTEQLVVDKCITIRGAGENSTTIQSPSSLVNSPLQFVGDPTRKLQTIIEVRNTSYVTMSDLSVKGPVAYTAEFGYGIFVDENSVLNLSRATVATVRENPIQGNQRGIAIGAGSRTTRFNQIGALILDDVAISDYQKGGITVDRAGSTATISNTDVTGAGSTGVIGQNGIQFSFEAAGSVTGGSVSGNSYAPATVTATGILLFNSGAVTVSGGTFAGNDASVYVTSSTPTASPVFTVSNNSITNIANGYGILFDGVSGTATNNFVSGGAYGISSFPADGQTVQVNSNSVTDATQGGITFDDFTVGSPTTTATLSANFNRISGNAIGIQNTTGSAVDAANNFFGCNNGPSTNPMMPLAGCDSVVGAVTATPYLILQAAASDSSVGNAGTSTITAKIVSNTSGLTATAFPSGVPISFATSPGTYGSVTSADSTLTGGVATATFTGGAANGGDQTETVTATVDNASAPVDITVEDDIKPTPTVSLASGQPATTGNQPFNFKVVFDEVVTDFDDSTDVSFAGSTADTSGATVTITNPSSDGITYNVEVSGVTGSSNTPLTVTLSVPADVAADLAGNLNNASTNSATVNYISPTPRDCTMLSPPYDVEEEFSLGSNPNCEYTYGYTATSDPNDPTFTKYPNRQSDFPTAGIDRWYLDNPDPDLVPAVFGNRNPTTTTYGSVTQPADALNLHPGANGPGSNGQRSVVRFTNPTAGFYKINGDFSGLDNTSTDVVIIRRTATTTTTLFSGNINGFGSSMPFDVPVTLAAGDIIDFSVGTGGNGYGSDSTGLRATITPVTLASETLYGLVNNGTTQSLVSFNSTNPNVATTPVAIIGLGSGETLVGIDFRPRNGVLYGVSSDGAVTGRIYTIDPISGAATAINSGNNVIRTAPAAPVAFNGTNFGVDFNPFADRIRVISDNDQSYRINPDTGITIVDMPVTAANTITAAAYTNNTFPGPATAAGTTLYDIDATNNTLYIQNPPNDGTLVPVGSLGITNASAINGFDISSAGSTTMTPVNNAYASFTTNNAGSTSDLYTINLTTGMASRVGKIGAAENSATGLSITGLTVAPAVAGNGDATFPTVLSIAYGTPATSPTNAANVSFVVTFSEAVTGVDTTDFALATGSISSAAITSVSPATCPSTAPAGASCYTVSVSTGTGDGTVGLNLVDNDSIVDASNNQLGGSGVGNGNFTGQVFTIDKTTPTIDSITSAPTSPTNMSAITFTVTFSEALASCNAAGFAVTNATPAMPTPVLSGSTCTVNVTATGSPVTLTVGAGAATDTAGNDNADSDSLSVVYDADAPTVTIVGNPPTDNTSPVNFIVTFSEPVTGFTASDVTVTGTAFNTGTTPSVVVTQPVSTDRTTYDVAVTGMNQSGTVTAQITGLATDDSGNASTQMPSATVQYTVANSPVTVNPTNTKTNTADPRTVWTGFDDNTNQFVDPSYVTGPMTPPLGTGSARLNTTATGKYLFASASFNGTPLSQITELSYSSYAVDPSNAANLPSLQIGIDYDSADSNTGFQGRLVFIPAYNTAAPNQSPQQNTWQRWTATNGKFGFSQLPGSASCGVNNPCDWATILATYPRINIPSNAFGFVGFRSTGGGTNAVENYVDAFTIGVNSANTTFDFEANPPTVSIDDATATEGNGTTTTTANFTVRLGTVAAPQTSQLETRVTVTTAGGTATEGTDYVGKTETVSIPAGASSTTFSVTVNGDDVFEGDETFTATLSNAVNAEIADDSGTGTITDDEAARTVSIANTAGGNEAGLVPNTFTVTLSGASASVVTVNYATSDNTPTASATAGSDYTAKSGTLTFNPGDPLTQTFTVATLQDAIVEGTETFNATLSMAMGATISGTNPAVGTIADDDNCAYTINGSPASAPITGGTMSFTVTVNSGCVVTAASNSPFITGVMVGADNGTSTRTVTYTVADNTATATNNGAARTGTITVTVPAAPSPQSTTGTFVVNQAAAPVSVDIPDNLQAINGATLTVPVNVTSNTTGRNIISFDFIVNYDPTVLGPPITFSTTGTMSSGFSVSITPVGNNQVQVSGFAVADADNNDEPDPLMGSGTLVNINFQVVGSNPSCGALTFASFNFNDGDPADLTSGGQACVISGATTGRVIYGNNRTPANTMNPNGTDDSATPRPVPNTTLTGVPSTSGQPTVTGMSMCPNGMYSLMGFGTGTYTVTPSKTRNNDVNGITSQDASRIQQAVLGSVTLTTRQMRVADVSKNNAVTSFDAALIQQYILNPTTASMNPQNNTGKWEFDPMNRVYTSTAANMMNEDYDALLLGEVTGNWVSPCSSTTPTIAEGDFRNAGSSVNADGNKASASNIVAAGIPVTLPDASTSTGMMFDVAINVGDLTGQNVTSYDFDILYDQNVIQPQTTQTDKTSTISSGLTVGSTIVEPGRLRVSAFGSTPVSGSGVLLKLKFSAVGANGTSSDLSFAPFTFNEGLPSNMTNIGRVRVLAPTAATATVSGRVTTASRRSITGVTVTLTDSNGVSRSAAVNLKGFYQFDGVRTGETYVISVSGKGFTGTEQVITVLNNLADVNLTF